MTQNVKSTIQKIWLDSTFRFWVSNFTLLMCLGLHHAGSIESLTPVYWTYGFYTANLAIGTWFLIKNKYLRTIDFCLCFMDITAITVGVYYTGGTESALYFLYFIPIIIQSFHRDWALIMFYGAGGVLLYSVAIFLSLGNIDLGSLADLVARILTMTITVVIAVMAVRMLLKQSRVESQRLARMKILTQVSQKLNGITSLRDIPSQIHDIIGLLNSEFTPDFKGWLRIFLADDSGETMAAIMNSEKPHPEFKQELSTSTCPAVKNNETFHIKDAEQEEGCPTERFSFRSHICIPISGLNNESYGVVFTGSYMKNAFRNEELEFLKFIGRSIGLTIQRLHRVDELQLSLEMDSCAMATYMASTRNLEDTYRTIVDGIRTIFKTDQISLLWWNSQKGQLEAKYVSGPHADLEKQWTYKMGQGIPGKVFEDGNPTTTGELLGDPNLPKDQFGFQTLICLPIQNLKGESVGVINAWHLEKNRTVTTNEIDIGSTFITRAMLAIENAQLHSKYAKTDLKIHPENKAA